MQRGMPANPGFVLPVVLGIILLAALVAVHAATELGSTALLTGQRLLHQRAFEAGESGLVAVMDQLQAHATPAARQLLQSAAFPSDGASVEIRTLSQQLLPNGYSAGRVLETHYELRSTGHSARSTAVTVVQGARQLRPLPTSPACRPAHPLPLRVRFAGEVPRDALLVATPAPGLALLDPATGDELWSIAATTGTQQLAGMNAAFGSSLTAVHLDSDGVHDRLYAGDRTGRLWRLDLVPGARPEQWAQANVLAEFSAAAGGRGFIAAPDVTRLAPADSRSPAWLNIAIGTAGTDTAHADHRFYVVRDSFTAAPARPLREADLEPLAPPLGIGDDNTRGFYLPLGTAQVLAQALTLDGRIHLTAIEGPFAATAACESGFLPEILVPTSVTVLRATDGALATDEPGSRGSLHNLRRALSHPTPAYADIALTLAPASRDGRLACHIDTAPLADCFLDTRPRRSWWRREDAD